MTDEERKILVEYIHSAFDEVSKPSFSGVELRSLQKRHWKNVTANQLRKYADELHNFSPEVFRYFLPAILTAVILYPKESDVLVDNVIGQLSPPEEGTRHKTNFDRRMAILDYKMKNAVKQFIRSYKQLEPHGAWSFMDYDKDKLEKAIEFWEQINVDDSACLK